MATAWRVKDKDQYNPKFGVEWNPWMNTTMRAAAFKVLKRTLVTDQTLEPTQVAGFNQFFDDANGASSWRYGVGIDQKLAATSFSAPSIRSATSSLRSSTSATIRKTRFRLCEHEDLTEYLGRAYAFWTPHPWWAFSAQYLYETPAIRGA